MSTSGTGGWWSDVLYTGDRARAESSVAMTVENGDRLHPPALSGSWCLLVTTEKRIHTYDPDSGSALRPIRWEETTNILPPPAPEKEARPNRPGLCNSRHIVPPALSGKGRPAALAQV